MPDTEELLNNFMITKNKEALGEKIEKKEVEDDNFLDDKNKIINTFKGESPSNSDNGLLAAKKAMNTFLIVPILVGGIFSAFYVLLKIGPVILSFFRRLLIGLFV